LELASLSFIGKPAHCKHCSLFDATDGDVIKSQNLFAIYDAIIGWNGTLSYLEAGKEICLIHLGKISHSGIQAICQNLVKLILVKFFNSV
jgi:hypothetical protein